MTHDTHRSANLATGETRGERSSWMWSWRQMLVAKFPPFDSQWPDDIKASWFDGFNELMTRLERQQTTPGPTGREEA